MKRHGLITRVWHWLNAAALIVLFMSGLNISNAHRYLYWGNYGFDPADAWTSVMRFPGWATLPQRYDLAAARDWHSLAAWVFAVALLVMWIVSVANQHFWRDLRTSMKDWSPRAIAQEIKAHLAGKFDEPERKYNTLQRITYGIVLGIFLPMMVFTGLAISPGFEPAAPWMVDALGGRQSARSLHFIFAWALFAFFAVHIVMVLLSGPIGQIKQMITGGQREVTEND
ncbi:cytochrome b/b6 domain-containing protein [Erythrobacter crassostreae]|uniref:Cytochrome b/b6 domain-containing protein n=1 Tax=Erythrobacter crassostreae TaxID=2828328 RepID=A0A9X1F529_9SPHN|nr:cytochrome b/b6 domain-containing protein [Erythrobacter crassostrea]MBV7260385.1 cytochrome b/b6 domain-containing protein [Erythrobacter crassostrea]